MQINIRKSQLIVIHFLLLIGNVLATLKPAESTTNKITSFWPCVFKKLSSYGTSETHHFIIWTSSKECLENVIAIKKRALEYLDKFIASIERKNRILMEINRRPYVFAVVKVDLHELAGSNKKLFIENLKNLLEFIFNDSNYKDGSMISKPNFSKKSVNAKNLIRTTKACLFLSPNFNSWCLFINYFQKYFVNLSNNNLKRVIHNLISNTTFSKATEQAKDLPESIDVKVFLNTFISFGIIFNKLKPEHSSVKVQRSFLLDFKKRLEEIFKELFYIFSSGAGEEERAQAKMLVCEEFLTIMHQFTPLEFYNLYLEEYLYVFGCFDYYLRSALGFRHILTSEDAVGRITGKKAENIKELLKRSEGFLVKHFRKDKKVWIHFGLMTLRNIYKAINRESLPKFWSGLRNYVVVMGGDGILMTFEEEPSGKSPTNDALDTHIRIKQCGFWNLVDPNLSGKVVLIKNSTKNIVIREFQSVSEVFLEIDGQNNYQCPCYEKCSKIILFYKDRDYKHNQREDLVKALPVSAVSETFIISNQTSTQFLLEQTELVTNIMLQKKPFKVSVVLCSNPKLDFSVGNDIYETIFNIRYTLLVLSFRNKNFRELSLEFDNIYYIQNFIPLLQILRLTTLKFSYFHSNSFKFYKKVFQAIAKNKFMMRNLKYFDMFPILNIQNLNKTCFSINLARRILEKAPLKRISLVLPEPDSKCNRSFQSLMKTWKKKGILQELELYLLKSHLSFSNKTIKCLKEMKLLSLSIYDPTTAMNESLVMPIIKHYAKTDRLAKSFHFCCSEKYFEKIKPAYNIGLVNIYPGFLRKHLIPMTYIFTETELKYVLETGRTKLLGLWDKKIVDANEFKNPLISRVLSLN